MNRKALLNHLPTLALLIVAIIWGSGFIATQIALDSGFSAGLIMFCRFAVAAVVLAVFGARRIFPLGRREAIYGTLAGLLLFLGFYVQTTGLRFTTPSNNGFFTATNVIMVPLIAWVLHKKRPPGKLWFCSLTALAGFFILAWKPDQGFAINIGDMLTLASAFFFACHIAGLGILSGKVDVVRLTFLQMASAALFSLAGLALFDRGTLLDANLRAGGPSVLYLGLFSTCVCFFLQTWAQGRTGSGKAALLLSGESLWCMVFSVMVGYERLTIQMVTGGLIIVGAVALLETDIRLPLKKISAPPTESIQGTLGEKRRVKH